ncbi:MAG: hypothetical protein ACREBC_01070 [Pyrinomonadaceae bacterium]
MSDPFIRFLFRVIFRPMKISPELRAENSRSGFSPKMRDLI